MSAARVQTGTELAIESLFREQRDAFASNPFPDAGERRRWPGLGRMLRPPYTRLHDRMARFLIG